MTPSQSKTSPESGRIEGIHLRPRMPQKLAHSCLRSSLLLSLPASRCRKSHDARSERCGLPRVVLRSTRRSLKYLGTQAVSNSAPMRALLSGASHRVQMPAQWGTYLARLLNLPAAFDHLVRMPLLTVAFAKLSASEESILG